MFSVTQSLLVALCASFASAHMAMVDPAPFSSKENPNTPENLINYSLTSPMTGANMFPCNVNDFEGFMSSDGAKSVVEWEAGSEQSFTIGSGARHEGGSCQASLSEDGGKTFKAIKNYIGNCPVTGEKMPFTVPADAKAGDAVFAWSWFNKVGNREMYMNCAGVTITGSGGSGLSSLPDMFVANVPGVSDCTTPEGVDIDFKGCGSSGGGSSDAPAGEPSATAPAGEPSATAPAGEPSAPATATGSPSEGAPSYGAPAPTATGNAPPPSATSTSVESSAPVAPDAPAQTFDNGLWNPGKYDKSGAKRALRRHARDLKAHY